MTDDVRAIHLDAIRVVTNPRKRFDEEKLQSLAESIDQDGLIQPILVRDRWADSPAAKLEGEERTRAENNSRPRFELVSGARRLRAHRLLERDAIMATIRDMDAQQAARIRLVENLHREDLHELDEAHAFHELLEDEAYTVPMLAAECGRSESYVYQRMKLLDLVDDVREAFLEGEIPGAHALAIARLRPEDQQAALELATPSWGSGPPSVKALQNLIARDILLQLKKAPFNPEDAELVPEAGPCTTCPKRTGNAPGLWPELEDEDRCTDRSCFDRKVMAYVEAAIEKGCVPAAGYAEEPPGGMTGVLKNPHRHRLYGGSAKCEFRERAIYVSGGMRGERFWICRDKACPTHGGPASAMSEEEKQRRDQEKERVRRRRAAAEVLELRILERLDPGEGTPQLDGNARVLARLLFRDRNQQEQKRLLHDLGLEPVDREVERSWGVQTETDTRGPFEEWLAAADIADVWLVVWRIALVPAIETARYQHLKHDVAMEPLESAARDLGYQPHNAWRSVRASAEVDLPEDSE